MTKQFTKIYQELIDDHRLSLKEMAALVLITDRMESSVQDMRFYDHEKKAHFVIYRFEQLAENMHVSVSSAKRTIKSLSETGYIEKKTRMNTNGHRITKYFLPHFVSAKSDKFQYRVKHSLLPPMFKIALITANIELDFKFRKHRTQQAKSKLVLTKAPKLALEEVAKPQTSPQNDETLKDKKSVAPKDLQEIQLHAVMRTLKDKCGIPEDAVKSLAVLAKNEPSVLAQYADQIFKAKVSAKNLFESKTGIRVKPAEVRFETNDYFFEDLPACIDTVVVNVIDNCKTLDKTCAYLFISLKSFFLEAIQKYKFHRTDLIEPAYVGSEIPMIDISDPNRQVRS